ncbi:MAG: autotransporter-associated beta strand repeat-containing protein, partial [Luteolibacter sp.]
MKTRNFRSPFQSCMFLNFPSSSLCQITIAATLGALAFFPAANAATVTWDGEANDGALTNGINYVSNVAPVSGDSLIFAGGTGTQFTANTVVNAYAANIEFAGISSDASAGTFVIGQTGNPVINLTGNIGSDSVQTQTINNPLALTASRAVGVTSRFGAMSLGGVLSEIGGSGFGLTKTGSGLLTLSGANTFTGPVIINGGTLAISSGGTGSAQQLGNGAPGAASITLNGGTLRVTAAVTLSANRGIVLGSGGGTFGQFTNSTTTFNGVISGGANAFTKTGQGFLVLGGTNTYTGPTTVNQGTLWLDYSQVAAPASNIINSGSALVLGGAST